MDQYAHRLADLLLAIEAEMRRIGLWQHTAPDPGALGSLIPFCHDTLRLEQWLQWVFLPKMKQVIEQDEGYPSSSDISPLAEYRFEQLQQATSDLLVLLQQFDQAINSHSLK